MPRVAVVDGALVPDGRVSVSPFDRGLWYGEGVFETMRTYGASIFALDDHLARLARSAERIGLALPCPLASLAAEATTARRAFGVDDAVVRVLVTAGSGCGATRVVTAEALPEGTTLAGEGVAIITRTRAAPTSRGAKTASYLEHLLARREAAASGAVELVFIDGGLLREGATSNVFIVTGGALATPPAADDVLAGITRHHVLRLATREGLTVRERPVTRAELMAADEVFLTSTLRGLAPVTRLDEHAVGGGTPGPVTRALISAFGTETGGFGR